MAQRTWDVSELSPQQQSVLTSLYGPQPKASSGYSPNKILFCRELTEHERGLFLRKSFLSPNFYVQALYKLKGNLVPLHFNRALHGMVNELEILRTNYCRTTEGVLAVVFQERREFPKVLYLNMEDMDAEDLDTGIRKAMEADMREGFDLQCGNLVRFSVFHTGAEEYAVLVTMAQAIMDRVDVRALFRSAMDRSFDLKGSAPASSGAGGAPRLEASMREYWSKILSNLPQMPTVPYTTKARRPAYDQRTYRRRIPADIMSDLREKAKSNKMMLIAILQTAWAILLQENSERDDVFFCLLVPAKKDGEAGGRFHMMPVRCKSEEDLTVKNLASQQFQQIVVSQPYSCIDWEGIQELTGRKESLFDHFLSFYDFMTEEQDYSSIPATPEGALVTRNSWDSQGAQLGMYFRYEKQNVSFFFLYDDNRFLPNGARSLADRYVFLLQQMVTDWNLPFGAFMERLRQRLAMDGKTAAEREDYAAYLQDVLSRIRLFQQTEEGMLQTFRKDAYLETRFEGDRISGEEIETKMIFVARGRVARNIDLGDGWYNTLDILKDGDWVNESVVLPERKSKLSIEILTEEAELVFVPFPAARPFFENYPRLMVNVVRHLAQQMEKYQRLWMQA